MKFLTPAGRRQTKLSILTSLVPSVIVSALLVLTSLNEVGWIEVIASALILFISWHSYRRWRETRDQELPFFAMLAFMYWLYYAVQLFWGSLTVSVSYSAGRVVEPERIRDAVLMALLGVCCVWLGMRSRVSRFLMPSSTPSLMLNPSRWNYVRVVLIIGTVASVLQPRFAFLGDGARQPVTILLSTVPLLAFTLLLRRVLRRDAQPIDKLLVAVFLLSHSISALSSGWLGSFASLIVLCGVVYAMERQRIPRMALIAVALCVLFFQVGKQDFRRTYWSDEPAGAGGQIERVTFWVQSSTDRWTDALNDPTGESLSETLQFTLARISLLPQTADVIEQTPKNVPYKYGELYSYLIYTWIPRAIWPDKPSMSEANQFYQVAYGITDEENLDKVSIAVGVLTEAYINFGWPGVIGIMFLLGIFLDIYARFFFNKASGILVSSLGVVLLPQMLGIESQMAQYLGGIVQQAVFALLVLLPAISFRRSKRTFKIPAVQYSR